MAACSIKIVEVSLKGMHPSRDTTALMVQQRLGRAGDAGL